MKYENLRGAISDGVDWPTTRHAVKSSSYIGNLRNSLGIEVDLPTEAQWEYACRAGTVTATYFGCTNSEALASISGWYGKAAVADIVVGHFAPNPWGLYDMYGGVLQWCLDRYNSTVDLGTLPCIDPVGSPTSTDSNNYRVQRSSGWNDVWKRNYSSFRSYGKPLTGYQTIGFRLVAPCVAPNKTK